jgi:hypothetical protein
VEHCRASVWREEGVQVCQQPRVVVQSSSLRTASARPHTLAAVDAIARRAGVVQRPASVVRQQQGRRLCCRARPNNMHGRGMGVVWRSRRLARRVCVRCVLLGGAARRMMACYIAPSCSFLPPRRHPPARARNTPPDVTAVCVHLCAIGHHPTQSRVPLLLLQPATHHNVATAD